MSDDSLLIWATSLNTGAPLKDVSLLAFFRNNTSVIPLGKTNKDGVVFLKNLDVNTAVSLGKNDKSAQPLSIANLRFITAVSATDSTFIQTDPFIMSSTNSNRLKPDWINQDGGYASMPTRMLKGHLFTERGIYRPGETVYFKATVREYKNGAIAPPQDVEPVIKIINSKNETVFENKGKTNEFGTMNASIVIKPYFPLGTYTLNMTLPGDNNVVHRSFQVQEFAPPRHFTEIRFKTEKKKDKRYLNLDKSTTFLQSEIAGTYYAGGPVKHGKVRWKIYFNSADFRKAAYKDYTFGNPLEAREKLIESGEAVLDETGKTKVGIPLSAGLASGMYGVEVVATVVDFDGKVSTESAVYQEEPGYLIGISRHMGTIKAGDSESLNLIVIDKTGKRIEKGKLSVEVMKKRHTYIRKRNDLGDTYWTSETVWGRELKTDVAIENHSGAFDFDFVNGGDHLIKFTYHGADGKTYTSSTTYNIEGYFYGYGYDNKDRNFERLNVSAEQEEYAPGETIRVFINPNKKLSSLLMTIEREGVIEHRTINAPKDRSYVDIPVKKAYEPNVYISFLGTVARGEFPVYTGAFDIDAPSFMFGVVNVQIKKDPGALKVSINDGEDRLKAEPGAEVKLKLNAKNSEGGVRAEIAVAVVDESVLAMTGFNTPTLDGLTKFVSALSVFTGELRAELLKQTPFKTIGNEALTGGDGLGKPEAATSKVRKDFNPVAYFNPAVLTDKNGDAEVSFKLPDTMTTYRVYAVAVDKGSAFASSHRSLLAVKDFYLEPGTPRFFTKGDRFKMYVSAFNKTDKALPVQFSLGLGKDSPVSLRTPSMNYKVGRMDSTLIPVTGEALKAGSSKLVFSGKLNGLSDAVELTVPVNSGHLMVNDVVFGTINNGVKIRYSLPSGTDKIDWADAKPDAVALTISGSPFLRIAPGLKYLLHYPYGCVEQTSSGVLPLAAMKGLIKDGLIAGIRSEEADKFLAPGVLRLLSMQTTSGGFAYWPGNLHPHSWGTIYATIALTHAKAAGIDVPSDQMNLAMNYLKKTMKEEMKNDRTFVGFASWVLALNNSLDKSAFMDEYAKINETPREGALMLLLSAKIMNHLSADEVERVMRTLLEKRWDEKAHDIFHARYREPAISLLAANAILPKDPITGSLAKQLIGGVTKEGIWTSTSDTGWSLVALGEYFKGISFADAPVKVTLRQEGWPETTITLDPKRPYTYNLDAASFLKKPEVHIFVDSKATITYSLSLTYPRDDYAKDGYSNGFAIKKRLENTDGSKTIKVGDVVKITLDLDVEGDNLNYLVLDDPLPAGFVAINSAIKTEEVIPKKNRKAKAAHYDEDGEYQDDDDADGGYYWGDWDYTGGFSRFVPNYFEIRNDRVIAFKDRSWRGRYQYSYYARAVIEGEFVMPSSKIQMMYDPSVVSYTPTEKITVEPR